MSVEAKSSEQQQSEGEDEITKSGWKCRGLNIKEPDLKE
jgi:hypothetical protein